MKILLTGPTGQVGSALMRTLPGIGHVLPASRTQLDLTKADSIRECIRSQRPQIIVNTAAYTAVDRAETEEDLAMAVNAHGPAVLAEETAKLGALLVHFSTDYVFDGEKPSPYIESDVTAPLNAYGRTKLAGEEAVRASGCRHLIFRTSWVYSASGNNFLLTMLRLARAGRPLRVVNDQLGAPTSSLMIADAVTAVIERVGSHADRGGIFHMSAGGKTTWYGFARAIFRQQGIEAAVSPIPSGEYPTPARRPRNSLLDNASLQRQFDVRLPTWEAGMTEVLERLQ